MLSVLIIAKDIDLVPQRLLNLRNTLKAKVSINVGSSQPLGKRKQYLLDRATTDWVLFLDTDEVLSAELVKEIKTAVERSPKDVHGYEIPYQNYVFGKPVHYGGERYSKVRLLRTKHGSVTQQLVHEEIVVKGKIGKLKGKIHHYSYRTPWQVLAKFTGYAWLVAGEKRNNKESVTLKKLFLYGPHMFWARFVGDQGWRDGLRGLVLAAYFGYMEGLTYWLLLWRNILAR